MMLPPIFTLTIIAILLSCSSGSENNTIATPVVSVATVADTPKIVVDSFADSLRAYFENPIDFYAIKKQTKYGMLDGGGPDMKREFYHDINNPDAIVYVYWNIEFMPPKYTYERSLQFATWKPWKTPVQKYSSTDNETLVGIRCSVPWNPLGKSNFIGMHIDSVKAKFGEPQAKDDRYSVYYNSASSDRPDDQVKPTHIYFLDDHLLLLHEEKEHIAWFKYYWWHENITSADSLPDAVLEWSE